MHYMECQYGLLGQLRSKQVFTSQQLTDIECLNKSPSMQNEKLLELMTSLKNKKQLQELCNCFFDTKQIHLVAYFMGYHDTGISSDNYNRLLTDEEQEPLIALRPFLTTEINVTTVNRLVTTGCISEGHMSAINEFTTQTEMNGELLDILRRRNLAQYKLFIQCLRETKLDDVVHRLENYQPLQLKKRRRLQCDNTVHGVAQLNNIIYVLCQDILKVYEAVSFVRLWDIPLTLEDGETVDGNNIAACSVYQRLYVANVCNSCITQVDVQNGGRTAEWMSEDYILSVSVTSCGDVIVTVFPNTVVKYTAEGEIIGQIDLPSDILKIEHAIETRTGTGVLISCEYLTTTKDRHPGVCEVTYGDHIIRSFDVLSLWDSVTDGSVSSFTITTDADGNVYVPDRDGSRVIVLDSKLNLRRVIHTDSISPTRLSYSQEGKQLIVGHRDKTVTMLS